MNNQEVREEVSRRIGEVRATGATFLDLSRLNIRQWKPYLLTEEQRVLDDVTKLKLANNAFTDSGLMELARSGMFPNLRELDLSANASKLGFGDFLHSEFAQQLTSLVLSNIQFPIEELENIAQGLRRLRRLENLSLLNCRLEDKGLSVLEPKNWPRLANLSLGVNKLSDKSIRLLSEAKQLASLQVLDLWNNPLLPQAAQYLAESETFANLRELNIRSIQLGPGISQLLDSSSRLVNLQVLHASFNLLNNEHFSIGDLAKVKQLEVLSLDNNGIGQITIEKFGELSLLRELDISETASDETSLSHLLDPYVCPRLTRLRMAKCNITEIDKRLDLSRLDELDLSSNRLSTLSENLIRTKSSIDIDLSQNAFTYAPTQEIVDDGRDSIVAFLQEQAKGTGAVNETRVLILGKPEVGKTTLCQKLVDPHFEPGAEARTSGIDIKKWQVSTESGSLNLWDFGGQPEQYVIHQYFITPDAKFVLVVDYGTDEREIFDQLNTIAHLTFGHTHKTKLLPFLNKNTARYGEHNLGWEANFDSRSLIGKTLSIEDQCVADLADSYNSPRIQQLRSIIVEFSEYGDGKQVPLGWLEAKAFFEQLAVQQPYIAEHQFKQYCTDEFGYSHTEATHLLSFLNYLGVVHKFPGQLIVVLDMEWLRKGTYVLFQPNHELKLVSAEGYVSKQQIFESEYWLKQGLSEYQEELFKILCKGAFDLVYEVDPLNRPGHLFVPRYLPPTNEANAILGSKRTDSDYLSIYFRVSRGSNSVGFVPIGLFSRLIVTFHENVVEDEGGKRHWANYVQLRFDGESCHLLQLNESKIVALVKRNAHATSIRARLMAEINRIVKDYGGMTADYRVACPECSKKVEQTWEQSFEAKHIERGLEDSDVHLPCPECTTTFTSQSLMMGQESGLTIESPLLKKKRKLVKALLQEAQGGQELIFALRIIGAENSFSVQQLEDYYSDSLVLPLSKNTLKKYLGTSVVEFPRGMRKRLVNMVLYYLGRTDDKFKPAIEKRTTGGKWQNLPDDQLELIEIKQYVWDYLMQTTHRTIPILNKLSSGRPRAEEAKEPWEAEVDNVDVDVLAESSPEKVFVASLKELLEEEKPINTDSSDSSL